jgi:hypothetical protein
MDLVAYRQDVRNEESRLKAAGCGEFVYTTSLKHLSSTAGKVCEVSTALAAKAIVDGVARLSTDEEITAFHVASEARRHQMEEAETRRIPSSFRVNLRSK